MSEGLGSHKDLLNIISRVVDQTREQLPAAGAVDLKSFCLDPFVDGFVFGIWQQFTDMPLGHMPASMKPVYLGMIDSTSGVWRKWPLFSSLQSIFAQHPRQGHIKNHKSIWSRGVNNGIKYVKWIYNAPGIDDDPDIQAAIDQARRHNSTQPLTRQAVADCLLATLFISVVKDRLAKPQ